MTIGAFSLGSGHDHGGGGGGPTANVNVSHRDVCRYAHLLQCFDSGRQRCLVGKSSCRVGVQHDERCGSFE